MVFICPLGAYLANLAVCAGAVPHGAHRVARPAAVAPVGHKLELGKDGARLVDRARRGHPVCGHEVVGVREQPPPPGSGPAPKGVKEPTLVVLCRLRVDPGDGGLTIHLIKSKRGLVVHWTHLNEVCHLYGVRADPKLQAKPLDVPRGHTRLNQHLLPGGQDAVAREVYCERDDRRDHLDAHAVAGHALGGLDGALTQLDLVVAAEGAVEAGPVAHGDARQPLKLLAGAAHGAVVADALVVRRKRPGGTQGHKHIGVVHLGHKLEIAEGGQRGAIGDGVGAAEVHHDVYVGPRDRQICYSAKEAPPQNAAHP